MFTNLGLVIQNKRAALFHVTTDSFLSPFWRKFKPENLPVGIASCRMLLN